MPLSFRTLRHLVPSSFRVKVTPVPELPATEPLPLLPSLSPPPELAVVMPEPVEGRRAAAARTPSAALTTDEPDPTPGVPGPATGPAIEAGVCGAAFPVCGAGAAAGVLGVEVDWLTEVDPGDDGDEVLLVS